MRRVPYEATNVGVEFKGVRSGVERRRGASGLKARDPGRRESPGEKCEMGRARLERPDNLLRLPGQHAALDVGEVKRLGSRPRRVRQRPRRDALPLVPQRGRPRVDDGRRRARDAADDDRARRASIRREVRVRAEEGETQRLRRRRLRVVVHTSECRGGVERRQKRS
eukprot:29895-Pelagococcus_subviridis.AAC.3